MEALYVVTLQTQVCPLVPSLARGGMAGEGDRRHKRKEALAAGVYGIR